MPAGYRSRSQYLALARFCQDLIESLYAYVEGHLGPSLALNLENAARSLEAVKSGDLYRFGQKKAAAFGSSEQVRTLAEIWSDTEMAEALDLIRHLLEGPHLGRKADARLLIKLFSRLRDKALWNFEQTVPAAGAAQLISAL